MPFNATQSWATALIGGLALTGGLVLSGGAATAQQTAPAQGQPPQQPSGPVKLELQPSQNEWTKVCGNAGPNRQICFTTRDFGQAKDQPPLIALAIYDVKGEDPIVRFLMPPGLLLRPGIRFSTDKGAQQEAQYTICLPNGCFAETKIKASALDGIKKATLLNVLARNSINAEITFTMPMAGFGKAFDGPAIDPKALQAQQEQQQQELQRQLQDRAKAQRQQLEGSGTAAPAPAAPAPAPAPKQ